MTTTRAEGFSRGTSDVQWQSGMRQTWRTIADTEEKWTSELKTGWGN